VAETKIDPETPEPIAPGWYAYSGGRQSLVFHLRETGQWSVHFSDGTASDCVWPYIEQALGVWDLVRITPPAQSPAQYVAGLAEDETLVEAVTDRMYEHLDPEGYGWAAGDGPSIESVVGALLSGTLAAALAEREADQ